jgi:hypothetical protein
MISGRVPTTVITFNLFMADHTQLFVNQNEYSGV